MRIKKINLCQNEDWSYKYLPRDLGSDYNPIYNFQYPFSNNIYLDCERIIYKLKEYDIPSEMCNNLNIVFINTQNFQKSELVDFTAFGLKKMKFINISKNVNEFNSMSEDKKRKYLLDSINEAIMFVTDNKYRDMIKKIIKEIFELVNNTECAYLNKLTKKYCAKVTFKSSLRGYDTFLYLENNLTGEKKRISLFENGSYADLEYKIHKISFKGKKCIIVPKDNDRYFDEPIVVELF